MISLTDTPTPTQSRKFSLKNPTSADIAGAYTEATRELERRSDEVRLREMALEDARARVASSERLCSDLRSELRATLGRELLAGLGLAVPHTAVPLPSNDPRSQP